MRVKVSPCKSKLERDSCPRCMKTWIVRPAISAQTESSNHSQQTRLSPMKRPREFRIHGDRYRINGDWVADLDECRFYATKHELTEEQVEERRIAFLSTQGIRNTIAGRRNPTANSDNDRSECVYLAFMMPKLALVSRINGAFHHTLSRYHHFSLYYGGSLVSFPELRCIRCRCEEAFSTWRYWRYAPIERPLVFAFEFFSRVRVDDLRIDEMFCNLSDAQIEQLQRYDCIPFNRRMTESCDNEDDIASARYQELRRLRDRDNRRRDDFLDFERTITPKASNDRVLDIKIRSGIVNGEACSLLLYLHDVLFYKCGVWYLGDIQQTSLLGPRSWHISMQQEGWARTYREF